MDIAGLATSISQAQTANQVQVAVARKAMDATRQQGEAALQLLAAASGTAGPGDELVAKATGLGGQIDVYG